MSDYTAYTAKSEIKNINERMDRRDKHVDNNIETLYIESKKNTEKIMEVKNEFTVEVNTAINNIKGMIIKFFLGIVSVFVVSGIIVILSSLLKWGI